MIDLTFRADVDPARRFVDNHYVGHSFEHFRKKQFLLIATG